MLHTSVFPSGHAQYVKAYDLTHKSTLFTLRGRWQLCVNTDVVWSVAPVLSCVSVTTQCTVYVFGLVGALTMTHTPGWMMTPIFHTAMIDQTLNRKRQLQQQHKSAACGTSGCVTFACFASHMAQRGGRTSRSWKKMVLYLNCEGEEGEDLKTMKNAFEDNATLELFTRVPVTNVLRIAPRLSCLLKRRFKKRYVTRTRRSGS